MQFRLLLLTVFTLLLAACASRDQYHWGQYEVLIYSMYVKPGEAPPERQIVKLTEDIQRARANGKSPGPGIFAHLGYMYALSGDEAAANQAFEEEMRLFPDAVVLIKGMQARAKKQARDRKH